MLFNTCVDANKCVIGFILLKIRTLKPMCSSHLHIRLALGLNSSLLLNLFIFFSLIHASARLKKFIMHSMHVIPPGLDLSWLDNWPSLTL